MENDQTGSVRVPKCLRCEAAMQPLMVMPLRAGGIDQIDLNVSDTYRERILKVDVFRCPSCSQLELFDIDFSLPRR